MAKLEGTFSRPPEPNCKFEAEEVTMTFLGAVLSRLFSPSWAAERIKLLAIAFLIGWIASMIIAQNGAALEIEWLDPY